MPRLSAEVEVTANADKAAAFAHIVPIDPASIFAGYGSLPAVTGTEDQVGAWDTVVRLAL